MQWNYDCTTYKIFSQWNYDCTTYKIFYECCLVLLLCSLAQCIKWCHFYLNTRPNSLNLTSKYKVAQFYMWGVLTWKLRQIPGFYCVTKKIDVLVKVLFYIYMKVTWIIKHFHRFCIIITEWLYTDMQHNVWA